MKTLLVTMCAMISMGSFSSTKTVDSLVFSGEKYFSICGTSKARINSVYDRFNTLCLTTEVKSSDVNVKQINHSWCILIKDQLLVTITKDDARLHNSSAEKLARKWANKLSNNIEDIKPLR
jgi:hypothetical protein